MVGSALSRVIRRAKMWKGKLTLTGDGQSNTDGLSPEQIAKRDTLLAILVGYGRVAVAFSAGVDSTVVAKAAHMACGDSALAVMADSKSVPAGEVEEADRLAKLIGIRFETIETDEFDDPNYVRNANDRCYYCKTELYQQLEGFTDDLDVDVIVNGANVDDRGDHRPGMQAANEKSVRSPLIEAGISKADVRALAKHWDLPVWDKPASPCLSSRLAYGLEVTPERVERVDSAERFLKELLNSRELRVRHEFNLLARIEIPWDELPKLCDPETRSKVNSHFRELGFKYITVDLEGFRSGSMNALIPLEQLQLHS